MNNLKIYTTDFADWRPSAVVALAAGAGGSRLAAAREDGSLEIWLVSPGSSTWHCQLTIWGNHRARVSSLVWLRSKSGRGERLLSSSIDGLISEWDLVALQQKVLVDSVGVSIWQMAVEPFDDSVHSKTNYCQLLAKRNENYDTHSDCESSYTDNEDAGETVAASIGNDDQRVVVACDDGLMRVYNASDADGLTYSRSFPRVSGRILSVVWSLNAKQIFSGSSDGFIRCWDTTSFYEIYRITVGLGGLGSGPELCVWSLLFLRCGTLVSGDSTGSVQFWDSIHGTLLRVHTCHKGDVNVLAAVPSHRGVFSAGSDGKVILYKMSNNKILSGEKEHPGNSATGWVYVDSRNSHTHDVRALAVTMPICEEDPFPDEKVPKKRLKRKPISFSYHKWARQGIPMLISGGDDTKLFAYPARDFTQFSPHDICPAPQRASVQLVPSTILDGPSMILTQYSGWLDVMLVHLGQRTKNASTQLVARIKSKETRKIICSALSGSGLLFAYSDCVKPSLFELRMHKGGKSGWSVNKLQLPKSSRHAHSMIFSIDSSYLMLAGHDSKICIVDVKKSEVVHTFVPRRKEGDTTKRPHEPPVTNLFTSSDGQWLAAANNFGDIYMFNLETYRQHWFVSRLNGASVTAAGFAPGNSNVFVVTTTSNQIFVFNVKEKQLGEWSRQYTRHLPRKFQEFPGEVIGLSFISSISATSVLVYSASAMCLIDVSIQANEDQDNTQPTYSDISESEYDPPKTNVTKRERTKINQEHKWINNFSLVPFKNPVLFAGHVSKDSMLVVEKKWMEVLQKFDAPIDKHIYGT